MNRKSVLLLAVSAAISVSPLFASAQAAPGVMVSLMPQATQTVAPGSFQVPVATMLFDATYATSDFSFPSVNLFLRDWTTPIGLSSCAAFNGSTQLNSGTRTVNPSGTGNKTFVFDSPVTIPRGQVTSLVLKCNISSAAPKGSSFRWFLTPTGTGASFSGVDVSSGLSITPMASSSAGAVFSISSSYGSSTAKLMASLSASSPSYSQVAGGTTGVTLGAFTLYPTGESIALRQIGLSLKAGDASAADVTRTYIYNGATLIGTATFVAGSASDGYYHATTTLSSALNLTVNQQTTLTIKADISPIGTAQPGTDGHRVVMNLVDAVGDGLSSGAIVHSGGLPANAMPGVAIFRTVPMVALSSSLSSSGVADGRLIAFTITASPQGSLGLEKLHFYIAPSPGASVGSTTLYGYTDAGFSNPVTGLEFGVKGYVDASSTAVQFSSPVEIPPGVTLYFLLRGAVNSSATNYYVATTLMGDSINLAPNMVTGYAAYNFLWSPNATSTSMVATTDWTNGYVVSGLPTAGIRMTRTNGPVASTGNGQSTAQLSNLASVLAGLQSLISSLQNSSH